MSRSREELYVSLRRDGASDVEGHLAAVVLTRSNGHRPGRPVLRRQFSSPQPLVSTWLPPCCVVAAPVSAAPTSVLIAASSVHRRGVAAEDSAVSVATIDHPSGRVSHQAFAEHPPPIEHPLFRVPSSGPDASRSVSNRSGKSGSVSRQSSNAVSAESTTSKEVAPHSQPVR